MSWGPRAASTTTKHTCNNGAGPAFGRKTVGCPRCDELLAGAPAVKWATSQRSSTSGSCPRCARGTCGVVCTWGDW